MSNSTNGHAPVSATSAFATPATRAENLERLKVLNQIVANATLAPRQAFQRLMDPRRNLEEECGYPSDNEQIGVDLLRRLYDRHPLANRVVEVWPKECWQSNPTVYEDENGDTPTEFEKAWDELGKQLVGSQSWFGQEKGSTIWEILLRADILSGIGHFGVVLLGIDDGKNLQDPADGVAVLVGNKVLLDTPITNAEQEQIRKDLEAGVSPKSVPTANTARTGYVANRAPLQSSKPLTTKVGTGGQPVAESQSPGGYLPADGMAGSLEGTDAQYFGVQTGPTEMPTEEGDALPSGRKLLFMQPFDESLVQIVRYEWNIRNPRFGQPVMYRITLNDPREQHSGVGLPLATVYVHWSRIIHLADNLENSKIFGRPRMRPCLHPLLDSRKIYGAGAEGYWKSCFAILSLQTHPQLGGDVDVDDAKLDAMVEDLQNGLTRVLRTVGMQATQLAPSVVDPSTQIEVNIEAICIQIGIPVRVFKGSERGELASSQDDEKWNDRVRARQNGYITPKMIVPLVDRLIQLGVLPEPGDDGYKVEWPDLDSLGKKDKASIFLSNTQALAAYAGPGNCEAVMPPHEWLTLWGGMDDEEVKELLEASAKAQEDGETMTIPPAGELGNPATPQPPPQPPVIGGAPGKPGQPPPGGAKPAGVPAAGGGKMGGAAAASPARPPGVS